MNAADSIPSGHFSHDLLIHGDDRDLVAGTVAFVAQGLGAGGDVLVHSSTERVAMMQAALGRHPRLAYGYDCDLYQSPMSTLFNYERMLSERTGDRDFWVTGTVPFGSNTGTQAAWTTYESLVNEVLGRYPFHALCTYDTRLLPTSTVALAMATHPTISNGTERVESTSYVECGDFLQDERAMAPEPPSTTPSLRVTLDSAFDLLWTRHLISRLGRESSAVARPTIDGFVVAVNEVLEAALEIGTPPVGLTLWVETTRLTCLVTSDGVLDDPIAELRWPAEPAGMWVARQMCDEVVIRISETATQVLLMTS